ncbi:MAG: ATP-binding cassette domain-containing protein [Alsobacter sp.]
MQGTLSDLPIAFESVTLMAGRTCAIDSLRLEINPGAPVIVVGPNGAGKSSLLRLAMGLVTPTAGRITWSGRPAGTPDRRAIVFQRPTMLRRSAAANLDYVLATTGHPSTGRRDRIAALLQRVGLAGLGDRPARRLSGGEQQRLAIARALAREPELLLLDEPTASLDPASTRAIETIIADAASAGVTVLMATHDLGQARRLAGRVLFLAAGRLVEDAPVDRFFTAPATPQARTFLAGDLVL